MTFWIKHSGEKKREREREEKNGSSQKNSVQAVLSTIGPSVSEGSSTDFVDGSSIQGFFKASTGSAFSTSSIYKREKKT